MDDLLCLYCYRDLDSAVRVLDGLAVECECGSRYTLSLLDTVDSDLWTRILRRERCRVERTPDGLVVLTYGGRNE